MIKDIKIGGDYTCIKDSSSVEVIEFKDVVLDDDSYCKSISTVVYIDENSDIQIMEINQFANSHD